MILAAAPETYVGVGLGVVIGDERIELHPRIVGLSHARYSDLSEGAVNMGVTARRHTHINGAFGKVRVACMTEPHDPWMEFDPLVADNDTQTHADVGFGCCSEDQCEALT